MCTRRRLASALVGIAILWHTCAWTTLSTDPTPGQLDTSVEADWRRCPAVVITGNESAVRFAHMVRVFSKLRLSPHMLVSRANRTWNGGRNVGIAHLRAYKHLARRAASLPACRACFVFEDDVELTGAFSEERMSASWRELSTFGLDVYDVALFGSLATPSLLDRRLSAHWVGGSPGLQLENAGGHAYALSTAGLHKALHLGDLPSAFGMPVWLRRDRSRTLTLRRTHAM